jgi:hypothetical protein
VSAQLQKAAAELSGVAHREWADFMVAMREYGTIQMGLLTASTLEELQRQQGRAQGVLTLLEILEKARKSASGQRS